jgi:hypothetical protein
MQQFSDPLNRCFKILTHTMKPFINFCIIWTGFFGCQRKMLTEASASVPGIPTCIQQKIDSIKQLPVWNPPAEIVEYEYGERKVYLISANCCDAYSVAVDSNCNYVCAPSGGFTGKGDRKCVDFFEKAKLVRLVWKDERGGK